MMQLFNRIPSKLDYPIQANVPVPQVEPKNGCSESSSISETPGDAEENWTDSSIDMSGSGQIDNAQIESRDSVELDSNNAQQLQEAEKLIERFYESCDDDSVNKSYFKAIECYVQLVAIEETNVNIAIEFNLAEIHNTAGHLYANGFGANKDLLAAEACFKKAAYTYADADSYSRLGTFYQRNAIVPDGIEKNDAKVLLHHRVAIQGGSFDEQTFEAIDAILLHDHVIDELSDDLVTRCIEIGDMFWFGKGVPVDEKRANAWYAKASKLSVLI